MRLTVTMTLGPATSTPTVIEGLSTTADRFRLNGSHLTPESLADWLQRLADLFAAGGRRLPVVLDLQGAKMRIGAVPASSSQPPQLHLVREPPPGDLPAGVIPVPHDELFEQVQVGEELSLNDGRVRVRIEAVHGAEMRARVTRDGPLASHKGINRLAHPVELAELTPGDRALMRVAEGFPFVEYAFSFVRAGEDAALVRRHTQRRVAAKLERPEALQGLDGIDREFDEIWLCRGDLGEQAGLAQLGRLQHQLTEALPRLTGPAYLAGQVLQHMTSGEPATRSEVVHLWDLDRVGWAGVVLSDETAVGRDPLAVARLLEELRSG